MASPAVVLLLVAQAFAIAGASSAFVERPKGSLRSRVDSGAFHGEVDNAMAEALGCGGHLTEEDMAGIKKALTPVWNTLPKNVAGRVERGSLRYLVHRYFNQRSALMVRGFEPPRLMNHSGWGSADILSQRVPAYVESTLQSRHRLEHGFDLQDAVLLVATIDQLIFDSEGSLLEGVYRAERRHPSRPLSERALQDVLESYLVHWMLGDDAETIQVLLSNRTLLSASFPHWDVLKDFVAGQIKAKQYERQRATAAARRPTDGALSQRYNFEDAHEVVSGMTRSFASFWESECTSMKDALVSMDAHRTGRVPLSSFYASALDSEWRFGESEGYLRELGALDESSPRGKQVIIPNYIQAASNCIVSAPHYLVCCMNYCEGRLSELEAAVAAPTAEPAQILALVANMSWQESLEEDSPPTLDHNLRSQLEQIAAAHDGRVPLHGRLFAQWLHYVFPRECPFPHKAGTSTAMTPAEFGEGYVASDQEMQRHVSNASHLPAVETEAEDAEWMSQWSHEEELIASYGAELRAPWEEARGLGAGGLLLLAAAAVAALRLGRKSSGDPFVLPLHSGKSHFV